MTVQRSGDLFALLCSVACALGNIVAKIGLVDINTSLYNFYFFLFAFLVASGGLLFKKQRAEVMETSRKLVGLIFMISILFSFGLYTFLDALKYIEPATVSFLSRIEVVMLVVLAYYFLKERMGLLEIIGGLIAIAGVLVLKYNTSMEISSAATKMLISAGFFAAAEIMVKKYINRLGNIRFIFFRNMFTLIIMALVVTVSNAKFYLPDIKTLTLICAAALLLPIFGRLTFIQAMRRIKLSRAVLITQTTPLFTAIFAYVILSTLPTPSEWLGGVIIIGGVIIVKLQRDSAVAPIR